MDRFFAKCWYFVNAKKRPVIFASSTPVLPLEGSDSEFSHWTRIVVMSGISSEARLLHIDSPDNNGSS